MIFNFIATTFRYKEDDLIDELDDLIHEFEARDESKKGYDENGGYDDDNDDEEYYNKVQNNKNKNKDQEELETESETIEEEISFDIVQTNISGLICGSIRGNPQDFINFLRVKLQESPWEIRYLLRFLPIQRVVLTDLDLIKDTSLDLITETITNKHQTIKIYVEKRHTNMKKMDIIDKIGPHLNLPVDLTNPQWILLIEIIGKYTGISILKRNMLFSSMIEKRSSD